MSAFGDTGPDPGRFGVDSPILIRTKVQRPRLDDDLIQRPHLLERLNRGLGRKVTLISAQAGAGKTTLLAQWLERSPQASAWLSLDEHDNDLMVFVIYLCGAIRTVFPNACQQALDLLNAPQTPPPRILTTSLVNELDALFRRRSPANDGGYSNNGLVLALDDYHTITNPAIHELLSNLIAYQPRDMHLVLASRTDPPLPLAGLRARNEMSELRTANLRLTREEAGALLELTAGKELSSETIDILEKKTDGWAVGLRLAALSIRDLSDVAGFVQRFSGASSSIVVDYLASEVFARQSPTHQDFLLRTSILDRFSAELCDAILSPGEEAPAATAYGTPGPSQSILQELMAANLFLVSLDRQGRWFRYHHLFRDLLQRRLQNQRSSEEIAALHSCASRWFEQNGRIEEALNHAFSAGDMEGAARIVFRQRYTSMNQARWQRLDLYLRRFPPQFAGQQPDLLMLKAWLLYHHGHYRQLPAVLQQLEATLGQEPLTPDSTRHLKGEISALRSLLSYYQTDAKRTITEAEFSIRNTPPELWIVRILARLFLAGAYQMKGDLRRAYATIYQGADEEVVQSNRFKATLLLSACSVYWVVADLQGLVGTATQCIELCDYPHSAEIKGYAHYHLGCAYYHRNDLAAAEEHFAAVVQQPYLNYGDSFAHSAFGLSLTYQAQNRPDEAREMAAAAVAHMLETGNTTLLPETQAFQAELALRQGQLAVASHWAAQFDSTPPLSPMPRFYRPLLTLAKTWLAQDAPSSRQRAAEWLDRLQDYTEFIHNTAVLIEVLALQAVLHAAEEDAAAALAFLERAIGLAEPGAFVRLFVDLGPLIARLLQTLNRQGVSPDYTSQILAAFPKPVTSQEQLAAGNNQRPALELTDALTPREMEVLELLAKRLSNKEIAQRLVVSPGTVKTHTVSIYSKLDVHGRRQAVDKARELGLLSSI